MLPRKRKVDSATTLDAPKKAKLSVREINDLTIIWQLEICENKWEMVKKSSIFLLNKAWKNNQKQVILKENEEEFEFDLLKLNRVCRRTSSVCSIRCCVKLKLEDNVLNPNKLNLRIEFAYRNNISPAIIKLGIRLYTFDFKKGTKISNSSKEVHRINRTEFVIEEPSVRVKTNVTDAKGKHESLDEIVPIDVECRGKINTAHVYYDGDVVWSATLNQTILQYNSNKFFITQLLEEENEKGQLMYCVWYREGRVGNSGHHQLLEFKTDLVTACETFEEKFFEMTGNEWNSSQEFRKLPGSYDWIETFYTRSDLPVESKLPQCVKNLMEMVFDVKAMEDAAVAMKYDTKKTPLGKLTKEQIKAGYWSLKEIESLLQKNDKGHNLIEACNKFYTQIPHSFGKRRPSLITTLSELRKELSLLQVLADIHDALKTINRRSAEFQHPTDNHYLSLQCELNPLDKNHQDYKRIESYLHNSHASAHNYFTLNLEEIFICNKHLEKEKFLNFGNRMLLWHGSRMSNFGGILSRGLQIAPPEAPTTGFMFGKGVYFADRSSKSANYCFASKSKNIGLLLLSEVSLGECSELIEADFFAGEFLREGTNSVMGIGHVIPDPTRTECLDDGVTVPLGKGIVNNSVQALLNFNEYIVYNVDQIRMRYLVKVKFNFV